MYLDIFFVHHNFSCLSINVMTEDNICLDVNLSRER